MVKLLTPIDVHELGPVQADRVVVYQKSRYGFAVDDQIRRHLTVQTFEN
jgi:hypothetical protein